MLIIQPVAGVGKCMCLLSDIHEMDVEMSSISKIQHSSAEFLFF